MMKDEIPDLAPPLLDVRSWEGSAEAWGMKVCEALLVFLGGGGDAGPNLRSKSQVLHVRKCC